MRSTLPTRLCGAATTIAGATLGWFGLWKPLHSTGGHGGDYDIGLYATVPTLIVLGAFLLVGGGRIEYRKTDGTNLTRTGWLLMAAISIGAAALMAWCQPQFAALGVQGR